MAREVRIQITGDASSLARAFGTAGRDADSFASKVDRFGAGMASVGQRLSIGLTLPIIGLGKAAIDANAEVERVGAQTAAAIASTAGAAHVGAAEIGQLAANVSKLGAVDDEAVQAGENLLLTFTNIRNEVGAGNDIFSQATVVMADMSQALGQDLSVSAMQLGKALNDPVAGVTALRRVGVQLTDQQTEQIKKFVESGDVLSAQKVILAELTKEFGGSAAAFAATDTGKTKAGMIELGNAMERLGAILAPLAANIAGFLADLATKFQALSPHSQELIVKALGIAAALGPVLMVMGRLVQAFSLVGRAFMFLANLMMANPWILLIAAVIALVVIIVRNWDTIKAALAAAWEWIANTAATVWNAIKTVASAVWEAIKEAILAPIRLVIAIAAAYWHAYTAVLSAIWTGLKAVAAAIWAGIKAVIVTPIQQAAATVLAVASTIKSVLLSAFDAVKSGIASAVSWVVGKFEWLRDKVAGIVRGIASAIKNLPFVPGSPIPLVVWTKQAVDQTLGVFSQLQDGLPEAANVLMGTSGPDRGTVAPRLASTGGSPTAGTTIQVTVNVHGSVTAERDLTEMIRTQLLRIAQRNNLALGGI